MACARLALSLTAILLGAACATQSPTDADVASARSPEQRLESWIEAGHLLEAFAFLPASGLEDSIQKAYLARLEGLYRVQKQDGSPVDLWNRRVINLWAEQTLLEPGLAQTPRPASFMIPSETMNPAKNPFEALQATVTIFVDEGVRLENGVRRPASSLGSGFFINDRGLIITNHHVIQSQVDPKYEGISRLSVILPGTLRERVPARVLAWDPVLDLALLKTEAKVPAYLELNTSFDFEPGTPVRVLGSPLAFEGTLTSGVISNPFRPGFQELGFLFQLDAPLNPGNSGGPIVDEQGRVIGISVMGSRYQGLNFGIPIQTLEALWPAFERGGRLVHSWLGLGIHESRDGWEVTYVVPGSPAEAAGLKSGARRLRLNGQAWNHVAQWHLASAGPPDERWVLLEAEQDGANLRRLLPLVERPETPLLMAARRDRGRQVLKHLLALELEEVDWGWNQRQSRVLRVLTGGYADDLGLAEGDPLELRDWIVDPKEPRVQARLWYRRRLGGNLESEIQVDLPLVSHLLF